MWKGEKRDYVENKDIYRHCKNTLRHDVLGKLRVTGIWVWHPRCWSHFVGNMMQLESPLKWIWFDEWIRKRKRMKIKRDNAVTYVSVKDIPHCFEESGQHTYSNPLFSFYPLYIYIYIMRLVNNWVKNTSK